MEKREYLHLSLSERDTITTMLAEKKSLGEIAKQKHNLTRDSTQLLPGIQAVFVL
jgi:IS30 family transposase